VTIFHGYAPFFKLVFTNWLSFAKRSIAFLKLSRPLWNIASSFLKGGYIVVRFWQYDMMKKDNI
ncbi:MAG: hypothetical protein AB1711_11165, partial [Thermodesulfobacteriota bacterium]